MLRAAGSEPTRSVSRRVSRKCAAALPCPSARFSWDLPVRGNQVNVSPTLSTRARPPRKTVATSRGAAIPFEAALVHARREAEASRRRISGQSGSGVGTGLNPDVRSFKRSRKPLLCPRAPWRAGQHGGRPRLSAYWASRRPPSQHQQWLSPSDSDCSDPESTGLVLVLPTAAGFFSALIRAKDAVEAADWLWNWIKSFLNHRVVAKLAHRGGAKLHKIQLSLGHASLVMTERYLGVVQDLTDAPCDYLHLSP